MDSNNKPEDGRTQLSKNNHYVPRMYLKQWADSNHRVYLYNLLVSSENVPLWKKQPISRTASLDKIYVRMDNGAEKDDFETYFALNFEEPASGPLKKVCNGEKLYTNEWMKLIDFITAQYIRTISFYTKIQPTVVKIVNDSLNTIIQTPTPSIRLRSSYWSPGLFQKLFPILHKLCGNISCLLTKRREGDILKVATILKGGDRNDYICRIEELQVL